MRNTKTSTLKSNTKGITLIALVITIIVLLILAGVTIATLTGDNGILTRANDAKIETAVATVKEAIKLEQVEKSIDSEEVNPETLLADGKLQRTVQQEDDGNYYMYYALKENAYDGMQGLGKGNITDLKDVFLIDDDLNVKYIASNGKEYGDNINSKILEDETIIRFSSPEFAEYIRKISGADSVDKIEFQWMKNLARLTINDSSIDNLQDLIFFPNLNYLGLNGLNLTSLDGIENCKKINTIEISNCAEIKDWRQLEKMQALKTFNVSFKLNEFDDLINSLRNIDIKSLGITTVGLQDASNIRELTTLESLNLAYNSITNIDFVRDLKELTSLKLQSNNISDFLCISELDKLNTLYLKGNPNIDGNRDNYTGEDLEKLNKIGKILVNGGTITLDVDKIGLFNNYKSLDLSGQNLTNIEMLEGMNQLVSLNLNNNKLTFTEEKDKNILKSLINLKDLDISQNYIEDISFLNSFKNLTRLSIWGDNNSKINLKQIEDIISNVALVPSNVQFQTLNNCDKQKITKIYLNNATDVNELPQLSNFEFLDTIIITNSPSIKNWGNILQAKNLKTINLSYCNMTGKMVDFSSLESITDIKLDNNFLSTTDISVLKNLNNRVINIDLTNNSIIDANILINLHPSSIIKLTNNVNLSPESKQALTNHFGNNVTYNQ